MKAKPKPKAKKKVKVADLKATKKAKSVKGGAYSALASAKTTVRRVSAADNDYTWVSGFCC